MPLRLTLGSIPEPEDPCRVPKTSERFRPDNAVIAAESFFSLGSMHDQRGVIGRVVRELLGHAAGSRRSHGAAAD